VGNATVIELIIQQTKNVSLMCVRNADVIGLGVIVIIFLIINVCDLRIVDTESLFTV